MGVRHGYQSWQICLFYLMIKPFQGLLLLVEENPLIYKIISLGVEQKIEYDDYTLAFPKQHRLITIPYTLALHPPLTRTTEMDEIGCGLGLVGCVRLTEDNLWDLGSRGITFVLSERLLAIVCFSMKVPLVVFQHDFVGPLPYERKVQCFLSVSKKSGKESIYRILDMHLTSLSFRKRSMAAMLRREQSRNEASSHSSLDAKG